MIDNDQTTLQGHLPSPSEPVPAWARAPRETGRAAFLRRGFPTTRDEEWKYTDLSRLVRAPLAATDVVPGDVLSGVEASSLDGPRLSFVNGRSQGCDAASRPAQGCFVGDLASANAAHPGLLAEHLGRLVDVESEPLTALNAAHLGEGAVVHVRRGVQYDRPIELLFVADPRRGFAAHPRVLVVLEEGSSATLVERYLGCDGEPYWTNAVSEVVVGAGASLRHVRVQMEGPTGCHVGRVHVRQARASTYASHAVALGAGLARVDIHVRLEGEGAECSLDGLYVGRGRQHIDHHTAIDHRVPHTSSRELYKGVLDESASGVFNGKVFVREQAQKTDAQQMNKNLLLSDKASIDTKPQLEIFADDVKCAHGATIGRLDAAASFYLRSRGIDAAQAREILIYAFANEMIARIPIEPLRVDLERGLGARFAAAPVRAAA